MSENLFVHAGPKNEKYQALLQQIPFLLDPHVDVVANMANMTAALKETFGFLWVGFYRVQGDILVLGPFQGPIACTRIAFGRGVCGSSWKEKKTLLVPDVEQFPGHIACSSESKSEIVVPVLNSKGDVIAVLDVDSNIVNDFDSADQIALEQLCEWIGKSIFTRHA